MLDWRSKQKAVQCLILSMWSHRDRKSTWLPGLRRVENEEKGRKETSSGFVAWGKCSEIRQWWWLLSSEYGKFRVTLKNHSPLAALGLCPCVWASSYVERGLLSRCGVRASHCRAWAPGQVGFRSRGSRALSAGSAVVAHRLSWPAACGTFLDQGMNPFPLHWQVDSLSLDQQGSPGCIL